MIALAPDQFAIYGKAWIEAFSTVLNQLISQIGILALAALAVWQNIRTKMLSEKLEQANQRLDRQGERIDQAMLAIPTTTPEVKIVNAETEPVPMHETEPTK